MQLQHFLSTKGRSAFDCIYYWAELHVCMTQGNDIRIGRSANFPGPFVQEDKNCKLTRLNLSEVREVRE